MLLSFVPVEIGLLFYYFHFTHPAALQLGGHVIGSGSWRNSSHFRPGFRANQPSRLGIGEGGNGAL